MQRKRRKKKRFGVFLFLLVVCIGIGIMFVPWAMQPENFSEVKNKINGFLSNRESCDFVLWVGTKRLLKRKQLEEFLIKSFSI